MDIDGENERNRELFRVPLRPAVQVFITRRWHLGEATVNHLGVFKHEASNHFPDGKSSPCDPQNKTDNIAS